MPQPAWIFITGTGYINDANGYQQAGQTILTASSTSGLTLGGIGAGNALLSTTAPAGNTIFGYNALNIATSSQYMTAIGYQALANTNDYAASADVAVGYQSLQNNTIGGGNAALGTLALQNNTIGGGNAAFGNSALRNNTTGSNNMAIGPYALYGNRIAGSGNVAVGSGALSGNFAPYDYTYGNTAIGASAGFMVNGGGENTLIGSNAAYDITNGTYNIAIGANVDLPSNGGNQQLNIGNLLFGTGLYNGGSMSSAPVAGNIGIGTTSPFARLSLAGSNGGTSNLFAISTSTSGFATSTAFTIDSNGNLSLLNGAGATVSGAITVNSAGTSTFAGNVNIGSTNTNYYPNAPLVLTSNTNSTAQVVLQNLSSGTTASTDYIVGNDKSTNASYYGDFGTNSSGNADPNYTAFSPNDVYLYSNDSNLGLATASSTGPAAINFFTGGTLAANLRMSITSTGNVGIGTTSPDRLLTVANNGTKEQLKLVDTSAAANQHYWTEQSSGGVFTINSATDANATTTALLINQPQTGFFNLFSVASTSPSKSLFAIDSYGHLSASSTAPVLSACGTGSPSLSTDSNDTYGTITAGTVATTCTLTFGTARQTGTHCTVTSQTASIAISYTESLSALVITNAALGGDKVDYSCFGQ